MTLFELFEPMQIGLYDPSADKISTVNTTDRVKPVLTLRKLNKLKKLRSFRQLNYAKRIDIISAMYAPVDPAAGM